MAQHPLWSEEYWPLIIQLYLQKPVGPKPCFSKPLVKLSLDLHIPPKFVHDRLLELSNIEHPHLQRLWNQYAHHPGKLRRMVDKLRSRRGFNAAETFYKEVELNETFETLFKPVSAQTTLTPLALTVLLDLYYQLTPTTMVEYTPEVKQLAQRMNTTTAEVVEVLQLYRGIDPFHKVKPNVSHALYEACRNIWQQYEQHTPQQINARAKELAEYFE